MKTSSARNASAHRDCLKAASITEWSIGIEGEASDSDEKQLEDHTPSHREFTHNYVVTIKKCTLSCFWSAAWVTWSSVHCDSDCCRRRSWMQAGGKVRPPVSRRPLDRVARRLQRRSALSQAESIKYIARTNWIQFELNWNKFVYSLYEFIKIDPNYKRYNKKDINS